MKKVNNACYWDFIKSNQIQWYLLYISILILFDISIYVLFLYLFAFYFYVYII